MKDKLINLMKDKLINLMKKNRIRTNRLDQTMIK